MEKSPLCDGSRVSAAAPGRRVPAAAGDGATAWAWLRLSRDYRAAWSEHAARPRHEDSTPFPVRIRSGADRTAERDWSLFAWEDPDGGALSAFFADVPMLTGRGAATAAPLVSLLKDAGARLEGLRLDDGALILKAEAGGKAVQVRIVEPAPLLAGGGVRLVHDWSDALPAAIVRLEALWSVTAGGVPRHRVGGRAHGNGSRRSF